VQWSGDSGLKDGSDAQVIIHYIKKHFVFVN
jgi:hypothetical protein